MRQKIFIFLLLISWTKGLVAQVKVTEQLQTDTSKINEVIPRRNEPDYQSQIVELNKQIITLTQTVASTKESFYNSNIYLWSFIITALGLIVAIAGYLGYRSISNSIDIIKGDNEKAINKGEATVIEIKNDLIQRIGEVKTDIKEYKSDIQKGYEKFEKESNLKIEKGLALQLQNAIDKIMKESFSKELKDLSEQLSDLTKKFENLTSKQETPNKVEVEVNKFDTETIITPSPNTKNNAFDEQD